ncbi:GntR family transcriptional regulator [Noviherbaspirillum saxi]|uniref:GntR family transcriptional regulator n=1 Tax=Noviherbaspirillum saxi TaxID=2320863 RepID=A0A3A3FKN6_9BURK|nr:GntR family transcriptional regulator [Noviherbaspirillum saxi]RJF96053.1 GntR family transcriptional regulator [Noviherbaspirillum saxi]
MEKLTSDHIALELRKRIHAGALAGGVSLKQEELADEFGVSRIPVREALKRLEVEGLIRHQPNKGAVVLAHSVEDVIEMLDIRLGLETRALELAAPRLTPADLDAAGEILRQYDATSKPAQWTDLNLQFHLVLYKAAGKPRLLKMIEELFLSTQRYTRILISHTVGREQPQREHHEMLNALRDGKTNHAISLLRQHILHTQRALTDSQ